MNLKKHTIKTVLYTKKKKCYFFRRCWKCEVVSRAKTISEAKLLINFKKYLK